MASPGYKAGLEDVVAGTSDICLVDGKEGRLVYCGYDIRDLAEHSTFEETAFLLWHKRLPTRTELAELDQELKANRRLPSGVMDILKALPKNIHPMAALRTGVSALGGFDPEAEDAAPEANLRKAIRLTAQMPTIVAAWARLRDGKEPVAPRADLSLAGNFLYMLSGKDPDEYETRVMDVALILHADHELNASTFTGRVVCATLSDIYSAVTGAVGALKGPLHGGANEKVMRMLLEIGTPDQVGPWLRAKLAAKYKVQGFGHRVYRTKDPRAYFLEKMSEELGRRSGELKWFQMSGLIEKIMLDEKGLYPNVDFFSASAYYAMGIPIDLYTPIFAISRVSGWTAHILEQYENNRLIRPRADYTGPERLEYVPVDRR